VGGLQRFEQRLESMVYGAFAKVFRSAVQPVEIAAALERECDNNAQILSRQRRAVPNDFHVELAATDFDRLAPYDSTLVGDLTQQLQEHADQQHYVFPGPITIAFESADDLGTGRFRIKSRAQAGVTSNSPMTARLRDPRIASSQKTGILPTYWSGRRAVVGRLRRLGAASSTSAKRPTARAGP